MPEALDGFRRLALGEQDIGKVVSGVRRLRVLLERPLDGGNRLLTGASLMKKDTQQVQRLRMVRLLAQDVPVNRFGPFELAALMQAKPSSSR